MPTLIVFSGLPASGKSSIARALAQETGALWLRIDSIEQAIRDAGVVPGSLEDAGYRAAHAVAEDNLRLGRDVVGDAVNPWMLTRDGWRDVGLRAGARVVEIETICSDQNEHRRRVETRRHEVPNLILPDWEAVIGRDSCLGSRSYDDRHGTTRRDGLRGADPRHNVAGTSTSVASNHCGRKRLICPPGDR